MTKYIENSSHVNLEEVYSDNIQPNLNNIETLMDGDLYISKKRESKKSKTRVKKTTEGESPSNSKRVKLTTSKKKSMKKTSSEKNKKIESMIDNKLKIIEATLSEIRKLLLMPEFADDIINMDSRVTCSNIDEEDCL